jgi:hypothetical protein
MITDRVADLEAALERVVVAARAHLSAIRAADGEPDDDEVWAAYVALNNASHAYDQLLNEVFGEVTPWDLEALSIEPGQSGRAVVSTEALGIARATDPYPRVVSIRQRRDYRVPSVAALMRLASEVRPEVTGGEPQPPLESVADAVMELIEAGEGLLDLPELEPLAGVVIVADVDEAYDADAYEETDALAPFEVGGTDRLLGRLDERPLPET